MPRESKRALVVRSSAKLQNHRLMPRFLRAFYGSDDEDDDEDNDTDSALFLQHQYLQSSRYCCARPYRPREDRFWWYTHACCDREFLHCFRMSRASFYKLLQLVAPNAVFPSIPGKRKMAPPHQQLLVFLKYVGTLGSDSCVENLGTLFGVSSGVCFNYINRMTAALLELYETVVAWPDPSGRAAIAERVKSGYDFPNCVGMIDGTLLPLAFRPARNGEDYFTRKGGCALNCLICCDDQAKVTYALIGWPGSTHDNRVWVNSAIFLSASEYFAPAEYLLGDSAFRSSQHMVPSFEKLPGGILSREAEYFNTKLARIRIRSEQSIGLLKARFQHYKGVRILVKTAADLGRIIALYKSVLVVHNLLIANPLPPDLQDRVQAECEAEARLCMGITEEKGSVLKGVEGTESREQLLHYLVELNGRF